MTYEQKAKEIVDKCASHDWEWKVSELRSLELAALITAALREAGNAKLEEAAALAEDGVWVDVIGLVSEPSTKVWHGEAGTDLAASIRSLIEKD